ncbi:MAG: hypothetical protein ACKO5M_02695, partial [Vulcanococcus sp.]
PAAGLRGSSEPLRAMARFLLVLQPRCPAPPAALIEALDPLLGGLHAEVDHRTPAHLSALLRGGQEHLRLQLFADVQAKAEGPVLELVASTQPELDLRFRSDRDGALPG